MGSAVPDEAAFPGLRGYAGLCQRPSTVAGMLFEKGCGEVHYV